jgi:biopolymer transport protein TolR
LKKRRILLPVPQSADVNVTPLIDIVLVLLIIFMVVSPLVNEKLLTQLAETISAMDARPDPTQIVVRLDRDGAIKINNDTITPDTYVNALRERLLRRGAGNKLVLFDADDAAGYGKLVNALDGARQAGAVTLGFVMPESKADK